MSWTLWAHFINTLLCWVHMERQILWRGCTNARWVNVFPHPMYILLRLASKCQANLYTLAVKSFCILRGGQFWLYTVHPLYGEARCNPVLSLWIVTKLTSMRFLKLAITEILLEAGNQRWTYDIHCCSDPKRTNNIGGRETFGRWTNLVFFSIVCPFVPISLWSRGRTESNTQALEFIDFQWKTLRSVAFNICQMFWTRP